MNRAFLDKIEENPIIAAVRGEEGLEKALRTDLEVIFVLYGDVCSIPDIVARIKESGKTAMVHMDLVNGLSQKDAAVDYIRRCTKADGIITTRGNLIPHAKEAGLATILRYFVLDSMALDSIARDAKQHAQNKPDLIEVLPGVLSGRTIRRIAGITGVPLICGGLIKDRQDVMNALQGGALAISSTNEDVWRM